MVRLFVTLSPSGAVVRDASCGASMLHCRDLNLGPYACVEGTLLAEPSLQPLHFPLSSPKTSAYYFFFLILASFRWFQASVVSKPKFPCLVSQFWLAILCRPL